MQAEPTLPLIVNGAVRRRPYSAVRAGPRLADPVQLQLVIQARPTGGVQGLLGPTLCATQVADSREDRLEHRARAALPSRRSSSRRWPTRACTGCSNGP